jgi:hypothetical protein
MATATAGQVQADTRPKVTGWVVCASVLLITAGLLNVIHGFTLLDHKSYVTTQVVYSNLSFWGWMFLIWGGLQALAGVLAWAGRGSGNALGVAVSGVAMILWFFMIFSAPFAALIGFSLNMVVIYALTAGANPDEFDY